MSAFGLKGIAAISMLLDHTGLLLFPQCTLLRLLGRLAFPLYACCIAEGFRYTRSRRRYFLQIFSLGLLCQLAYFLADGSMYLGVLITFTLSILLMWAWNRAYSAAKPTAWLFLLLLVAACVCLCRFVTVDYGFFGILLPLLFYVTSKRKWQLLLVTLGLFALAASGGGLGSLQWWSLLCLPILYLYNGKPGKYRMKYFFYVFYPAHLALLYIIALLV